MEQSSKGLKYNLESYLVGVCRGSVRTDNEDILSWTVCPWKILGKTLCIAHRKAAAVIKSVANPFETIRES